jgi:type IV fimbrial biogenesis protein FimT
MLHPTMNQDKQGGFTLIELMFTVVVLAVLLGIGVPNFRDFLRSGRMTSAANDLLTDINLARSESVKRRVSVTLCKSTDGSSCTTDASVALRRWIVFVDDANAAVVHADDGDGFVDSGEAVLKDRSITADITPVTTGNRIVFRPNGFPVADATNGLTRILMCDARKSAVSTGGVSAARGITISATGRPSVTRDKSKIDTAVADGGFGGCP